MFSVAFISGSRDFTQHLTSGELILIHSAAVAGGSALCAIFWVHYQSHSIRVQTCLSISF